MSVNEHERLSYITIRHKLEQHFSCSSTFHSHSSRGVEILKCSTCPLASYLKKVTCPVFFYFL